jgi:hypothetical protein
MRISKFALLLESISTLLALNNKDVTTYCGRVVAYSSITLNQIAGGESAVCSEQHLSEPSAYRCQEAQQRPRERGVEEAVQRCSDPHAESMGISCECHGAEQSGKCNPSECLTGLPQ